MKKVTTAFLKTIEPKRGRATVCIPDGSVGGLMIRYGARGQVEFSIAYRVGRGEKAPQHRRSLGLWWDSERGQPPSDRYLTLEQARITAMVLKEKGRAGDYTLTPDTYWRASPAPPPPKPTDSVEAVLDRYVRERISTLKGGGAERKKQLEDACATFLTVSISDPSLTAVCRKVRDEHMAAGHPAMANKAHAVLAAFFSWCADNGLIPISPMAGMKRPAKAGKRKRILTNAELAAVWKAADTLTPARRDCIRFVALTGLRRAEAADMTWSEIDGSLLTIPGARRKNDEGLIVPLSPQAQAILAAQPRTAGDNVFDFGGKLADISTHVADLNKKMGIPQWQLHDMRRTMASGMQRLRVPKEVADKCLGHDRKTSGTSDVYLLYEYLDERKEGLEIWGAHVESLTSG